LQFCVSSVSTERLNNCLAGASRDRFSLISRHFAADASKRITAVYLNPHISSMRAKHSNRGLNSSCGGCSNLARTVSKRQVLQRPARIALDAGV
jgi:bacterioferritin-associated ferredoxin